MPLFDPKPAPPAQPVKPALVSDPKPVPILPENFAARLLALEALVAKQIARLNALELIPHNFEQRVTAVEKAVRDQASDIVARATHLASTMSPAKPAAKPALTPPKGVVTPPKVVMPLLKKPVVTPAKPKKP